MLINKISATLSNLFYIENNYRNPQKFSIDVQDERTCRMQLFVLCCKKKRSLRNDKKCFIYYIVYKAFICCAP